MELVAAALSSLLPKLAALLTDEYKLQKGVRGEIKFLKAEMESMQAALNRVSKLPPQQIDDLQNIWVRDLKELSYDIEDSVDSFMLRVDAPGSAKPKSFRRFFDRTIGLLTKAKSRHHIADDIQDIKNRIHEVAGRRKRYKFPEVAVQPENTEIDPRLPALYEDVKSLVGIEGPAEKLTTLLKHGKGAQKQQLMVVSIVGVGGLGKTTLANTVYQRLRGEFQSQAFVSISLKPDINKIFSSILRQVSGDQYPNAEAWSHTEVIDTIRQVLEKKRYIIVIDDVWAEFAWTQIKCALIENNLGSRVIVTTRNADVAKFSCSSIDRTMYELDPLSYENSKNLMCTRVFNENEEMHSESMIQPIYDNYGSPTACRVHDMVLDLIMSISARENFVTILEEPCLISPACNIRRLSLRGSRTNSNEGQMILPETVNTSHVRSIIAFGINALDWWPPMSRFPVLRVLALKDTRLSSHIYLKDLGSLQHLRHLELGVVSCTDILEGIGNLKLLKTLHVWLSLCPEFPASIIQLPQLENLIPGFHRMKFPDGTGNLISLHELSCLFLDESPNTLAEIGNLTKLRVLRISGLDEDQSYVKTFLQALSNLANLRTVDLEGNYEIISLVCTPDQWTAPVRLHRFIAGQIVFSQVPWWFSSLYQLSSLSMCVNLLRQEDLDLLGALPVLRFLQLEVYYDATTTEEQLVVGADHPFRSLAEFTFWNYTSCWLLLEFARGVMPKLQRLELYVRARRRKAGGFDIGLDNLASLKHATIKVFCEGAKIKEVEDVEDKVRDEIERHPNHPMLELSRDAEEWMEDEDNDACEEYEESDEDYCHCESEDEDEDNREESEES